VGMRYGQDDPAPSEIRAELSHPAPWSIVLVASIRRTLTNPLCNAVRPVAQLPARAARAPERNGGAGVRLVPECGMCPEGRSSPGSM
jgi:hypothetical protein